MASPQFMKQMNTGVQQFLIDMPNYQSSLQADPMLCGDVQASYVDSNG